MPNTTLLREKHDDVRVELAVMMNDIKRHHGELDPESQVSLLLMQMNQLAQAYKTELVSIATTDKREAFSSVADTLDEVINAPTPFMNMNAVADELETTLEKNFREMSNSASNLFPKDTKVEGVSPVRNPFRRNA